MSDVTKRALAASFENVLERKPLDKVTVTDITDGCGLKRQTFYYHFADIFDLIKWMYHINSEDAIINHGIKYGTWQQGVRELIESAHKNRTFIMATYNSKCRDDLVSYLEDVTYQRMLEVIDRMADGSIVAQDREFLAHFYTHAFVGTILDWIKQGMNELPTEIINRLTTLVSMDFDRTINEFENRNTKQP